MEILNPANVSQATFHQIGGKAKHLCTMQKAGFPIPQFLIIPTTTIQELLRPIAEIFKSLDQKKQNKKDLQLISKEIEIAIKELKFPKSFLQKLHQNCDDYFGENYRIAVRSSATSEDGGQFSFAGQHATFLQVSKNELLQKIKECIASAWNFGALTYRLKHGLSIENIEYAIVLQTMIDAEKSGVSFSVNTTGNMADAIVVAGYGLGEGIVSDQVETDTYWINRQTKAIGQQKIVKKRTKIQANSEGVLTTDLEEDLQKKSVLTTKEIQLVFDYTMKVETLLKSPADVEFSFDKNGKLYLLQMRPITSLDLNNVKILDNTNIVESYPNITLPLSFSFAREAYQKVFRGSSKAFWVSDKKLEGFEPVFENLIAHFNGRVYYRLDNWYRMMGLVYSSKKSMQAWEKAVGLMHSESDKVAFSFGNKLKTILSIIWLIINYKRGNNKFFKAFDENYPHLRNYKKYATSPKALWEHYEESTARLFRPWYLTLVNDFLAFKAFGWLQDLVKKYGIDDKESLANDLLCGSGGVESEIAVLKVFSLKEQIQNNQELSDLFTWSNEEILINIEQEKFKDFTTDFFEYLEKYGDRTLAELKLETPSFRKNPLLFIKLLKAQLNSPIGIQDFKEKQKQIHVEALAKVNAKLSWWNPKKWLFNAVLKLAKYGLKNRENMRFCRTRGYGAVKDIFLEIGRMMQAENLLEEEKDVFYLDLETLKNFCLNNNRDNKKAAIEVIKEQYTAFSKIPLPNRIIYKNQDFPIFHITTQKVGISNTFHQGIAVSKGIVTASAAVIIEPSLDIDVQGKILVSKMTDPGWVFLMTQAVGLISEKGSLLSHTAIVGRELGIPVVVGIEGATTIFKDGELLRLDGNMGTVEKVSGARSQVSG